MKLRIFLRFPPVRVADSPGLNNREWIETGHAAEAETGTWDSPGLNNREWIETGHAAEAETGTWDSPGLNNREWIETVRCASFSSACFLFSRFK